MTNVNVGHPLYFRTANSEASLPNFMRAQLYATMATLRLGMNILFEKEHVHAKLFTAHGGLFKVSGVAQTFLANALNTPIAVMKTAGEGGAWGMALLAAYMLSKNEESLENWLDTHVFENMKKETVAPDQAGALGFSKYLERFDAALATERYMEDRTC